MKFKVGDRVEVIDEAIKGTVVALRGNDIIVLNEEGFEMELHSNEIVKIPETSPLHISRSQVSQALIEKGDTIPKKKNKIKTEKKNSAFMEVDLHIHQLVDSVRGMDNYDMLTLQLETARKKLDYALEHNIRNIVFIHGVGEGVLKAELVELFSRYKNLNWYDADFKRYGFGATEVYIYQNY